MSDLDLLAAKLKIWRNLAALLEDNFTEVIAVSTSYGNDPVVRINLVLPQGDLSHNEGIALRDIFLNWLTISLEDKECMAELAKSYADKTQEELVQSMISVVIGKEHA